MCHAVLVQRLVAGPTDNGADLSLADLVADQDGGYDDRLEVVDMLDLVIGELDPRDRRILSCRAEPVACTSRPAPTQGAPNQVRQHLGRSFIVARGKGMIR
ncbi:hypothetical protein [Kribbella sp. VKM Ac-2568]|uniref:hypothetical protein n=1 Tax=Kribbella sp. VKM Ac-2568 TaxID=2512219 RepID=UPI001052E8A9|nr:hypothetical protein [Kribbella sp. VKM Ac-2568]